MKVPRLALTVLLLFFVGLVSNALGPLLDSTTHDDATAHSEDSSCPDPCDDGLPCGPSCPCSCCPGHLGTAAFPAAPPSLAAAQLNELLTSTPDDLHPRDVPDRVFHPPRA